MNQTHNSQCRPRIRDTLPHDLLASVVVFLIAFPLSMGIAIASGVPIESAAAIGVMTAIVGGLVNGLLSGCSLQVSGPAAGLAVIVAQLIGQHGITMLGPIVLLAGAIQLVAGLLRVGRWFRAVSPALIQGMLSGIGLVILAAQFHMMVDDTPPGTGREFGGLINLVTIPQAVWKGLSEGPHQPAAAIGVLTIAIVVAWTTFVPERIRFVPGPLLGVIAATATAAVWQLDLNLIRVPENLTDALSWPTPADLRRLWDAQIIMVALAMAFIASAESLLTATAVDAMQQHAPRTKYDRELAAQGIGNMLCGALGLLPMTGVTVRSSTNVLAGARTRVSTMLHGVWILLFVALLPGVMRMIPVSCLAAVLVYTGYKLMNLKAIQNLKSHGHGEVAVYLATLGTVVCVDLLAGVLVGIALAMARLLYIFSRLTVRMVEDPAAGRTVIHLIGAATFIRLPNIAAALEQIEPTADVHIDCEELNFIDHACLELLANWERQRTAAGGELVIDWDTLNQRRRQPRTDNKTDLTDRLSNRDDRTAQRERAASGRG
jgi:MFS superfamily sulfate permease-like transporter